MNALKVLFASVVLLLNSVSHISILLPLALIKLVLPFRAVRRVIDAVLSFIAESWIGVNKFWMNTVGRTRWQVQGVDGLRYRGWYLVSCNHQSWVDIFVLQHLFNRRIPLLKFFLKHELIYVPVMGLAWWALDFPFMRRHSEAELRRHPEKRQQDLDATRRACAKFALTPTSVMNFVEGTRFTPAKQQRQGSGFEHLLQPKAGGLAMALAMLGERFDSLLDVTIVYPDGAPTFGQFLRGEMRRVIVRVERRPIPLECRRDDGTVDADFRRQVQRWLLELWQLKDAQISALLQAARAADAAPPAPLKA